LRAEYRIPNTEEFLNAEGAKVSQSAQKKKKRNSKLKYKNQLLYYFSPLFCALCETFAPSAFKKVFKALSKLQTLEPIHPSPI
jgi:hypothetical protein